VKVEQVAFHSRAERSAYIARRFRWMLSGKVLDVGCSKAPLRRLLPHLEYTGIDLGEDADLKLNLEKIDRLPFEDGTFDCVVCSDVLEHLDNLHYIFGELIRVAKRHVIISLPNNWKHARLAVARGEGSFGKYGLPVDPPRDRHKWFFGFSEAVHFIRTQAERHPVSILELFAAEKPRPFMRRASRRMRCPSQERYLNRYAHTLWAALEKE